MKKKEFFFDLPSFSELLPLLYIIRRVFETCAANQRTGIGVADQRQEDINTCAKLVSCATPATSLNSERATEPGSRLFFITLFLLKKCEVWEDRCLLSIAPQHTALLGLRCVALRC